MNLFLQNSFLPLHTWNWKAARHNELDRVNEMFSLGKLELPNFQLNLKSIYSTHSNETNWHKNQLILQNENPYFKVFVEIYLTLWFKGRIEVKYINRWVIHVDLTYYLLNNNRITSFLPLSHSVEIWIFSVDGNNNKNTDT